MQYNISIKSHVSLGDTYLQFHVENENGPCGTIDFIAEKINFNISSHRFIFKGMERIKDTTIEYKDDTLVFIFSNKKKLLLHCQAGVFEKMNGHIKVYRHHDDQHIKDSFFSN